MQTRKRAKSVMFGRKHAEPETKERKEALHHHVVAKEEEHKHAPVHEPVKTVEKAAVVERRIVREKPQIDDSLSAELPKTDEEMDTIEDVKEEKEAEEVKNSEETESKNDLEADSSKSEAPEAPKDIKEALSEAPAKPAAVPENEESSSPAPLEIPTQPAATPEQSVTQGGADELSDTLPPSAFTIQNGEPAPSATNAASGSKKKFVVYFLVVAFISFVLGLGAMAGASYFGLANLHLTTLTNDVHVPGILAKKPTPTPVTPTAAPTQKPVKLSAFTISVLNGSGIAGKAATEKATLTAAGFTVSSVGNAANSNFSKTEISAKSSVDQAFLAKLENTLQKDYQVDTTISSAPASSQTDVTVTLGSSTAQ